jgi:PAS domain S-box-containing protein
MTSRSERESRVLILAPTGRDGSAAAEQLTAAGVSVAVCRDVPELISKLNEGAGSALVAEEALRGGVSDLAAWVLKQPTWSDLPFVVLTSGQLYPSSDAQRITLLDTLGNVTLLERPLSTVSLASTLKAALRARRKQYITRAMLEELKTSEERLRLFIEHAPAALVMLDKDMKYLAVSRRWKAEFDLRDAIIGKSHYEVFPEIPEDWREGHRRCLEGATESFPASKLTMRNGRTYWLKREVRPWLDNQGCIGGLVIAWEDVTASKQAEERQQMLMREVLHRTKNLLAVIQSIAAGTFRSVDAPAHVAFQSRLQALARAHSLVLEGEGEGATLEDIVRGQLASFAGEVFIEGPTVQIRPNVAQAFALLVHELATNASKYGALASSTGKVSVTWSILSNGASPRLKFTWRECGGPPVSKPKHIGFGTKLLKYAVTGLDSSPTIDFAPEGLVYQTSAELSTIQPITELASISRLIEAENADGDSRTNAFGKHSTGS